MTAPVTDRPAAVSPPPIRRGARVTQVRVMRSEWTKLRSLRSTLWSLLAAVAFVIGLAVLVPSVTVAHWPPRDPRELLFFDPTSRSLAGIFLAQLAIGALGVLLMSGEYATGMIRTTFAAVPTRLPVLWAKLVVFAGVTFALMLPTVLGSFLVGQKILSSRNIQASLWQPGVARAVIGAALYITVVGALGMGLGALLRNTAAAVSTLFGVLFVLPIIIHLLPSSVVEAIDKYLPSSAGQAVSQVVPSPLSLSPWVGFALFCGYAAAVLATAAVVLRRRDA